MKHRAILTGALSVAFVLAFATSVTAAPAKTAPAKPVPAKSAPTPAASPAPAPMGQTGAGSPAPAPMAEPEPSSTPAPVFGATGDHKPGDKEAKRKNETRIRVGGGHGVTSTLVPIFFFLCVLALVGIFPYMGFRKDRNKHETLRLMVEKGAQIPVELITNQKRRGSDLRRGLVLVGAGLGIALFMLMVKGFRNSGAFGVGLVPALIGAGYLLAWKLEGRKHQEQLPPTVTYPHAGDIAHTERHEPNADETTE